MEKIKWCTTIKGGLGLVEPNHDLAKAYLEKSDESLATVNDIKHSRSWRISASYYSMYFALYAILMKIGVKCEVHACTIEFMKRFLGQYFSKEECKFLEDSMGARIDAQYYVDRPVSERQYQKMVQTSPGFAAKCRKVVLELDDGNKINGIRAALKAVM